ncbi:universal stress protein [Hyphobacterium sp. CCMP332]|nr:universal stress protein [Hyphobacterium sp. CCMP332]
MYKGHLLLTFFTITSDFYMISVLVPTDFSKNAYHALKYAISMINGKSIHVILLNTYQLLPSTSEMFISIDDILQKNSEKGLKNEIETVQKEFPKKNFTYDLISLSGSLKFGIKQVIKDQNVDLVMMGTCGATGLEKLFIGSNASDIIKSIGKPVVILPDEKKIKKLDKIVLAIGYSEPVDAKMLQSLKLMAELNKSRIHIVSIVPEGKSSEIMKISNKAAVCAELEDFPHSYELIEGSNVVDSINSFVLKKKANMLAVIPHKMGFFESFFHKSVSKELVLRAQIPMMAMH